MKQFGLITLLLLFGIGIITSMTINVSAQGCTAVYGGGQERGKPFCLESMQQKNIKRTSTPQQALPTPQTTLQTQQSPANDTMTKGGLSVQPQPTVQTTPETGPEALALLALLPLGFVGRMIQKKASV